MEVRSKGYLTLDAPTLDEAFTQLFRSMPDTSYLPYCKRHGFLPRFIQATVNIVPNRELNIGGH